MGQSAIKKWQLGKKKNTILLAPNKMSIGQYEKGISLKVCGQPRIYLTEHMLWQMIWFVLPCSKGATESLMHRSELKYLSKIAEDKSDVKQIINLMMSNQFTGKEKEEIDKKIKKKQHILKEL